MSSAKFLRSAPQEPDDHGVLASIGSVGDAYDCDDAQAAMSV